MKLPIVKVMTHDGLVLHGFLSEPKEKSITIIIHIHGSAGNFYQSTFYPSLFALASKLNLAFLTTNNRGTGVYDIETGTKFRGAAVEIFEECLLDIDAWIEFAFAKGYNNIILQGHSFGTNKIQYYTLHGKHRKSIKALILLGFTDSYGGQLEFLEKTVRSNEDVLSEAEQLIKQNKPWQLLADLFINWGELPQTAKSYINFMSPGSALSQVLPLRKNKILPNFRKINIPILGIVGDTNECTVIPPQDAVNLLNRENKLTQCSMIKNCNHCYEDKEAELGQIIRTFIKICEGFV